MRNIISNSYTLFMTTCLLLSLPSEAFAEKPLSPKVPGNSGETAAVLRQTKRKVKKRKRRRCSSYASPRYRRMMRNWRKPPRIPKPKFRDGYRDLTLYAVNHGERLRFFPYLRDGTLDVEYEDEVKHIFRDKHTDAEYPIHPRLIKLLYRIADRFDAKQINIISGYRESPGEVGESKHGKGQAVDFMIPGVGLAAVARAARSFGHVGVGFYPNSGFVHLDVREGPSYFWADRSGPGKRSCMRRILAGAAAKADRKWRPAKDAPKPHKNRKGELLGATEPPPETAPSPPLDLAAQKS